MCILLDLHSDILRDIIVDWLEEEYLGMLDIAVCNKSHRSHWLDCIQHTATLPVANRAISRHKSYSNSLFLMLNSRNIKFTCLVLYVYDKPDHLIDWRNITILSLNDIFDISKIVQRCCNVTNLSSMSCNLNLEKDTYTQMKCLTYLKQLSVRGVWYSFTFEVIACLSNQLTLLHIDGELIDVYHDCITEMLVNNNLTITDLKLWGYYWLESGLIALKSLKYLYIGCSFGVDMSIVVHLLVNNAVAWTSLQRFSFCYKNILGNYLDFVIHQEIAESKKFVKLDSFCLVDGLHSRDIRGLVDIVIDVNILILNACLGHQMMLEPVINLIKRCAKSLQQCHVYQFNHPDLEFLLKTVLECQHLIELRVQCSSAHWFIRAVDVEDLSKLHHIELNFASLLVNDWESLLCLIGHIPLVKISANSVDSVIGFGIILQTTISYGDTILGTLIVNIICSDGVFMYLTEE